MPCGHFHLFFFDFCLATPQDRSKKDEVEPGFTGGSWIAWCWYIGGYDKMDTRFEFFDWYAKRGGMNRTLNFRHHIFSCIFQHFVFQEWDNISQLANWQMTWTQIGCLPSERPINISGFIFLNPLATGWFGKSNQHFSAWIIWWLEIMLNFINSWITKYINIMINLPVSNF